MSRASRIIVADADSKNAGLLAFGFEREGIEPVVAGTAGDVPRMAIAADVDGVVLSMGSAASSVEALKALRSAGPMVAKLPVLAVGEVDARAEVLAAGAADYLPRPNYVRDVVAMVRFHTLRKPTASPSVWAGELGDFAGIFYLIRGLSSTQRTGVLTIVRSLRRAELRFFEGEITSAQVGSLHGMAALHQVLLWTEGKLDFRAETVVRRQQIPLQPGELIDDLGRFLRDFHELAPELGPGIVLEQDIRRVAECVDKIPKEVNPVLRLFDGARTLSDIVEDSPFRVFETVKIAARLVKLGALKAIAQTRARGAHAALKVDDWMVGSTPVQGVPILVQPGKDSEPVGPRPGVPASPPAAASAGDGGSVASARQKKKAKKERERAEAAGGAPAPAPAAAAAAPDGAVTAPLTRTASEPTDWGRLTGAASSVWDLPGYAPVVPSQVATGEISSVGRPAPDANLATAGKVVAQDLTSAVQNVARTGASGATPKVLVDDSSGPAIKGKAAERVDEISAPIPREIAPTPQVQTIPGPAPAPISPALARARAVAGLGIPVAAATTPAAPVEHAPSSAMISGEGNGNGTASGVISGALESRSAPESSEPEVAEKIVVIDADFDPPRPPSVEIEIVRPPEDAEEPQHERTAVDAPSAPPASEPVAATSGTPLLRNIADEEPSDAQARMPNVMLAPQGLAPVVPVAAPAAPEAVVVATPSAPTTQMSATSVTITGPTVLPPPVAVPVEPPALLVSEEPTAPSARAIIEAETAQVVQVPAPVVAVPVPAIAAPAAPVAAVAEEAARSAADAAHAAARALSWDAIDEEFFNQEHQFANAKAAPHESFDDLDGHHHAPPPPKRGFWSRLLGNAPPPQTQRRPRPTTAPPPAGPKASPTTGPKASPTTGPHKSQAGSKPTGKR